MEIMRFAVDMAKRAGLLLRENLGMAGRIEFKGAVDLVTEMDRRSEELIVDGIRKNYPDHGILTEESEEMPGGSASRWIIDPLDGTTNYAHGFPVFCVSIAFETNGKVVLGVVYDPMRDELFIGGKNKGASLNGNRIMVSKTPTLDRSLLATGFPYDVRTSKENNLVHFGNFAVRAQAIRRGGSAALDLCYIASGRFDGFWEMKLKPWDISAGALIIKESGGVVTDFQNKPFSIESGDLLATNGLIHEEMYKVLNLPQAEAL